MPAPKIRHQYSGGAIPTTVTNVVLANAQTITGNDFTTWPTGQLGSAFLPVPATINKGGDNEEKIWYSGRNGNTLLNVERGADGSAVSVHQIGEPIAHTYPAQDADEANSHLSDDTQDDHSQYVHISKDRTITANHTHTGDETHNGNDIHNGQEIHNGVEVFHGPQEFPDNPHFGGHPLFDNMASILPTTIGTSAVSSGGGTGDPADAGHTHGVNRALLENIMIDPGTIRWVAWDDASKISTGWHIADGSAISRTTFAATFALMGTKFGTGDGTTTFNLPNLIGKFAHGATVVGGTGGADLITLDTAHIPAHNHSASVTEPNSGTGHAHGGAAGAGYVMNVGGSQQNWIPALSDQAPGANSAEVSFSSVTANATTGISVTTGNTGGGTGFDNRPAYVDMMPLVKVA